ncbi:MAG: tetratricopeptide repeat protein, partial [Gemmatimonadota bacterium]
MKKLPHLLLFLPALALIAGCQAEQQEEAPGEMVAASAVVEIPVTSTSDAAMADFTAGQHAMDMARPQDANELFEAAVEKDPTFGFAYLRAANTAASLEEFKTNLDLAAANMEGMSDGERVLVEINMTFLDSDVNKRLQLAKQLVEAYPASPRALLMLANVQGTLQEHGAARTSIKKALELDPTFVPGHRSLGLSYLFNDPKDFNQAETHMQHVVELAPEEASAYINLGDVFRAEQELLEARDSYKTAAEIDATSAIAFSKSGHANSFLGNYDEARVDYDRAIELAEVGGAKAAYAGFRAYV